MLLECYNWWCEFYYVEPCRMKENVIQEKSFQFALSILMLCKDLKQHNEFEIAKQLLRCATSIGANVEESAA